MCVLHHFRDQTQHPQHDQTMHHIDQTMHHNTQYLASQDEASALHGYHSNGRGTASFSQIDPRTLQAHTNLFEGHLLLVGLSCLPSELVDQPTAEQRAVGGEMGRAHRPSSLPGTASHLRRYTPSFIASSNLPGGKGSLTTASIHARACCSRPGSYLAWT